MPPAGYPAFLQYPQSGRVSKAQSYTGLRSMGEPLADHLPTDTCQNDPDLAAVVDAWPELPEALKAGIVAMVKADSPGKAK